MTTPEQRGWLIEHHSNLCPGLESERDHITWLCVKGKADGFGAKEFACTDDANKALRFARKEDAEAVLAMHLGAAPPAWYSRQFSVTEHIWT